MQRYLLTKSKKTTFAIAFMIIALLLTNLNVMAAEEGESQDDSGTVVVETSDGTEEDDVDVSNVLVAPEGSATIVEQTTESDYDENGNEIDDVDNKWFIGSPINVNYGYVFAGVWQESERETAAIYGSEPGFVKILDANNDGTIDENDKQIQGQKDPKFTWGLTNTLTYKDFTLSFFIYGSHGATKVNNLWSDDVWTNVRRNTTIKDWYTDENPSTTWYKNDEDANKMMGFTASTYENASYVRLKDLTLAYNIPSKIISKWNISKLQVYFTGRNLCTITSWTGIDPEFDDQWSIPLQKEYVFGVSMGF